MKRIIFALCCAMLLFTFVSCSDNDIQNIEKSIEISENNNAPSNENTTNFEEPASQQKQDDWGISMSVSDVTPKGLTLTITQNGGAVTEKLQTGTAYKVSKLENNIWVDVPYIDGIATWTMIAFEIPANDKYTSNLDWSSFYGSLSAGKYRVEKQIMHFKSSGNFDEKTFSAEFEIVDDWSINLSAKAVTADGLTLVISQSGGNFDGEFHTGSYYKLQNLSDNIWSDVPYAIGDDVVFAWDDIAYIINKNGSVEMNIDWSCFYGSLSYGKYRIEKLIMGYTEPGVYDNKPYYAEFEIKQDWGITASVKGVSCDGLTLVISQSSGKDNVKYGMFEEHSIQQFINNTWQDVVSIPKGCILYPINKDKDTEYKIDFEPALSQGKYRIIKEIVKSYTLFSDVTKDETQTYFVEFTINSGEYQKVSNLNAEGIDTNILFKFNDILFGKSFLLIDYANSGDPIGEITKLIDQSLVPQSDSETNSQELSGALVYECDEKSAVLYYNNDYHLFEKIA